MRVVVESVTSNAICTMIRKRHERDEMTCTYYVLCHNIFVLALVVPDTEKVDAVRNGHLCRWTTGEGEVLVDVHELFIYVQFENVNIRKLRIAKCRGTYFKLRVNPLTRMIITSRHTNYSQMEVVYQKRRTSEESRCTQMGVKVSRR